MPKTFSPKLDQVVRELKKRTVLLFKLEEYLFPEQLAFVNDPSAFKVAVTTRRAGKTVSCAADLIATCLDTPEVICLYITLSRTNAKRIVWPELKRINRKFALGLEFNESELSARAPNGSIIYCSGASDRTEIEKFRGLAIKKAYIDECQSFPAYIQDLIDDVIAPSLMDYAGSLSLIGTPGPIPTGFFYDCSRSSTWSQHKWTFWNNYHISEKSGKTHDEILDRELKRRGVSISNPSIQREWFGNWVLDSDSLVYHYNEKLNDYKELPNEKLTYILGVDLGYNDADAIAVLAWGNSSSCTYLVEEIITRKQTISELVEQIEQLRGKYDVSKIVVDMGGLGKKIGEELSRRYKIAVQPADKVRKAEYIELMNDALRTGKLLAKRDTRFADECMKVEWDMDKSTPDKKVISKRFHSDICEAVLYAWRESYSFTHVPEKPRSPYGTPDWQQEERDRLEEEAMEHFQSLEDSKTGFGWD